MSLRSGSVSRRLASLLVITAIATLVRGGDCCYGGTPVDSIVVARGFRGATAFCVTPSGTIYLLEGGNDRLLKIAPGGGREAETGGYGWGEGGFDRPADVTAVDDLELFVADRGNDRIVRLDRTLALTSVFETRSENVTFRFPLSVALTDFGKLLIVDGENARVVEIGKDDRVTRVFGGSGTGGSFLRSPLRVRADGSRRVAVRDGDDLVVFDPYGNRLRTIPSAVAGNFIAFDASEGVLTLVDSSSVRTLDASGALLGRLDLPAAQREGVPVDVRRGGDNVYVLFPDRLLRLPAPAAGNPPGDPARGTGRRPD